MEGIAARAHTGKAALYRRWASKHDLVHAALVFALPPLPEPRSGRSARDTLLTLFTAHRDVLPARPPFPAWTPSISCCTNRNCAPSSPTPWWARG